MYIQAKSANRQIGIYYLTLLICGIPALGLLWAKGYNESFLWLNDIRFPLFDVLMPHYTHVGEGAFLTGLFALLMRKKQPAVVFSLTISMLLVLVIIGPLKHQLFETWARPLAYFERDAFHYIALRDRRAFAFPSGHSAAAVSMLTFFALAWPKPGGAVIMGLLAALAAYSRVYIGVHFLGDILFGAGIGIMISLAVVQFLYAPFVKYFEKMNPKSLGRWQLFFFITALATMAISLYELIRTYYI